VLLKLKTVILLGISFFHEQGKNIMGAIFRFVKVVVNCRCHRFAASVTAASTVVYIFRFVFLHVVEDFSYFSLVWTFDRIVFGKIKVAPVIQVLLPVLFQNIMVFFERVFSVLGIMLFFQSSHAFSYRIFKHSKRFFGVPGAGTANAAFFAIQAVYQKR